MREKGKATSAAVMDALVRAGRRMGAAGVSLLLCATVHAQTPVTIQPPNLGGASAGTAEGSAEVSASGAARYVMPIAVPPGTAGLQPALHLQYDSQAPEGWIGLGWSLQGLGAITRCPAILAVESRPGKVSLDAQDRFCLDGKRLVLETGTYGANGTYRTEVDEISRIKSFGSDTSKGPDHWTVETKAGLILTFGATPDAYVEASGTTKPLLWALNRVEDRHGNFYVVQYAEDNANGEHLPLQISYTGNTTRWAPYAAVRFEYEARPDPQIRFTAGSASRISKRLRKVSTWIRTAADGTGGHQGP